MSLIRNLLDEFDSVADQTIIPHRRIPSLLLGLFVAFLPILPFLVLLEFGEGVSSSLGC
jgi:hypothetical protein